MPVSWGTLTFLEQHVSLLTSTRQPAKDTIQSLPWPPLRNAHNPPKPPSAVTACKHRLRTKKSRLPVLPAGVAVRRLSVHGRTCSPWWPGPSAPGWAPSSEAARGEGHRPPGVPRPPWTLQALHTSDSGGWSRTDAALGQKRLPAPVRVNDGKSLCSRRGSARPVWALAGLSSPRPPAAGPRGVRRAGVRSPEELRSHRSRRAEVQRAGGAAEHVPGHPRRGAQPRAHCCVLPGTPASRRAVRGDAGAEPFQNSDPRWLRARRPDRCA